MENQTNPTSPLTICQQCQGWSVIKTEDGQVTCSLCRGEGYLLQIGKYRLGLEIPAIIPYGKIQLDRLIYKIRNLIFIFILLLTFYAAYLIFNNSDPTLGIFNGFVNGSDLSSVFWLLSLSDMWGIYLFSTRETPVHSLKELDKNLFPRNQDGVVDGLVFYNEEAKKLISEAIINTEKQHKSILTKEILFQTLLLNFKVQLIIARLEINPKTLVEGLKEYFNQPEPKSANTGSVIISPIAKKTIIEGLSEAEKLGFEYVDVEDIFLAFLRDPGAIAATLTDLDITYDKVKAIAFWINEEQQNSRAWAFWRTKGRRKPKGSGNRAWTSVPTPFLDRWSRDLTKLASIGALPIVRVRDKEIKSILSILARTEKNNCLLIGEPGVGKTSIAGAIAERVLIEDVPEPLKDKRLVALDIGALASAGASSEENFQRILSEIENAGNVILYVSHVEALVTSGSGGFNAGTILADALSRGRFQLIASATPTDRYRYIEKNPTLTSLFQIVDISEVSEQDAIIILEEEAPKIEARQKVLLTYPAIKAAVELSHRYIPDKVLPDKAMEIIDQSATLAAQEKEKWVTDDYVLRVMKERTNVPVEKITAKESEKLLNLETTLRSRVIGQEEAVHVVAEALKRARVGLKDEKRPMGSFLFVGPTGVGKTETAKALAASYFSSEEAMIRIDMSEYKDAEAIYRLIGPPPKSDNFIEGGALTIPVREKPFCLILLDEFEKAHPDVTTLFLQLLDDGRLTENTGRTVSYSNTIVIATSNAGTKEISDMLQKGVNVEKIQENLLNILKDFFKPELINRFDKVVVFKPMDKSMLLTIATNMIKQIADKLLKEQEIKLIVPPEVIAYLAEKGFDPVFGARPLRRVIQDRLEGSLANILLQQKVSKGSVLSVTLDMVE